MAVAPQLPATWPRIFSKTGEFLLLLLMTVALFGILVSIIVNTLLLRLNFSFRSKRQNLLTAVQWVFLPVSLIIFGAIPAIDAQTRLMLGKYMGFWATEKARRSKNEMS